MVLRRAAVTDAEEILSLQKLAYRSEAEIYGDWGIEPLRQSLDALEEQFTDHVILKALAGDRIIGSVRACFRGGACRIGRLIVHPDWQNQGIGKSLMTEIERRFPAAGRFELFTGDRSARNLRLYEGLGYTRFKVEAAGGNVNLVFLKKVVREASSDPPVR